ncbi:MAG: purine-nucleoside phosphorylase [Planctomycetes bacterium]|nr:purine-nucleoside phosphorylase [Planctomycetota bacterium]MCC7062976.1 purine-nucleoside phosphorylase [Planctomycetota bacterium]
MSAVDAAPSEAQAVAAAAAFLQQRLGATLAQSLRAGIVLGSGLKDFRTQVQEAIEVPFAEVPGWPVPKVEGHGGSLVVGRVGGTPVACLTGRVHLYEGWRSADAVRAVRTLRMLGIGAFLLTNAAGGIGDDMAAGDLMVLTDHLNLTGGSPLIGPHEAAFGPRFPDQTRVYSPRLRTLLQQGGARLRPGVYAGLLGPSYETPAEVRMLKTLGADAVGMSTVHEAIALNAMGAEVAGLSLITNLAAGISDTPLSHDEVVAAGKQAATTLTALVTDFCRRLQ